MKMLNLKKKIEFKHNIENIIYDNFNSYLSLHNILSYIIDDIIEIIENDDEIEIDDPEIINISGMIKENLLNKYHLFNIMPIYENDKLINLKNINNFNYNYNIDKYNLIQYTSIMNFLNDYHEIIYDHDEKNFYDKLNNDEFDDDEYYELFDEIEIVDPENKKFKLKKYEYNFKNDDVFIISYYINKFELIDLFYKYVDLIVDEIENEIIDDIKNYYKYV